MPLNNDSNRRTIIVGDVHGCIAELEALMQRLAFKNKQDRLIFVGDLINKGPASHEVFKLVQTLDCEAVLGNHEWALYRHCRHPEDAVFAKKKRLASLARELGSDLENCIQWIESLPLFIESETFDVIHAGVSPLYPLKQTPRSIATLIRTWDGKGEDYQNLDNPPWFKFYNNEKLIVFGHYALMGLVQGQNFVGLDSGCVYGGELSALVLPEREIVQIPAFEEYCPVS